MEAERALEAEARACGAAGLLSTLRTPGRTCPRRLAAGLERLRAGPGLSPALLARLVGLWLKSELAAGPAAALAAGLVPAERLTSEGLRPAMAWLRTNSHRPTSTPRTVLALGWLQGLMEYNLLDMEYLDLYYEYFFFLLNYDKMSSIASKFIFTLSKPKDVTRGRVLMLLKIAKTYQDSKHKNCLYAVLNLFKTYKPECVPENIPMVCTSSAFPKVNKIFVENFQTARMRCDIQSSLMSEERLTWWTPSPTKGKRQVGPLIPNVDYIQIGSNLYSNYTDKKKCMEFQSVKDLLLGDLGGAVNTPANILSLLINDAGLHMIMNSDESLQSRFSHVLYHTLYNNFIERSEISVDEKRLFLKRIITLEKYIMQGIPVVSRFLALYISNWDGEEFFSEILELLEWITFDSFTELYDCILEHIETLYLTNNNYYCCSIVNMLKRMYIRLHYDMISNDKQFFLRRKKTYNDIEILTDLTDFMKDLCERSIHEVYASAILRNTYLDAYSTITKLQLKCDNALWTIAPVSLVYGSICSPSAFGINKTLGMIMRYQSLYEKVKDKMRRDDLNQQILQMQYYCADITNCLCLGETLKFRKQGLMLETMPDKMLDYIPDVEECNKLLHIKYHVAFAIYTYMQMPTDTLDIISIIPPMFTNIVDFAERILCNETESMIE